MQAFQRSRVAIHSIRGNSFALQTHQVQKAISTAVLVRATRSYSGYGYNNDYDTYGAPSQFGSGSGWGGLERKTLPRNTIIKFVPQQEAWIVERMGKFHRMLEPGLNVLMPIIDRIKYVKSLKETAIEVPSQSAITQDNVTLELDGVLYYRIVDPFKASYGVEDAEFAITQLAQTTMRAEIGQMTLDRTLAERAHLNSNIVDAINSASDDWGIRCLRYEIRDIHPPAKVVESMHQQVSAERTKRAQILESEGARQAAINVAEGRKQATILASEAEKSEQINKASGEAEAILLRAQASAKGIEKVALAIGQMNGKDAVSMTVAEKYVDAFGRMAKEGTTMIVPASANDAASMVAQALSIYNSINKPRNASSNTTPPSAHSEPSIKDEMTQDLVKAAEKESTFKEPTESS
ncbi:stomatin family protein [Lichtheimia corymbifera JMRC:FSU:9682]|uniref:Stomatin family protein n=1 Tax=Lichtheimia corymbifera JMRC:FSU:9682 TaxID=1263082 RepID=A0A068RF15_9FUNG|nr:stomatin family protein [Lichtheimia corymbifera JMRC:FSU:9682]